MQREQLIRKAHKHVSIACDLAQCDWILKLLRFRWMPFILIYPRRSLNFMHLLGRSRH